MCEKITIIKLNGVTCKVDVEFKKNLTKIKPNHTTLFLEQSNGDYKEIVKSELGNKLFQYVADYMAQGNFYKIYAYAGLS